MGGIGIKLSVHPLFFALGFYYAATGRIFEFAVYTVTAVIHELGHSFAAAGAGYRLNKIVLMPFGAVVRGSEKMRPKDEVAIAAAGPAVNLAVGVFFVALWWMFPELYAFTDTAAAANFSMALINLLPAYPLDGGRILCALISERAGADRAFSVCRALGVLLSAVLLALFIVSCFNTFNISLLFFAVFVTAGAFSRVKDNVYVRAYTSLSERQMKRGVPIKRFAVSDKTAVKQLIKLLDPYAVNEVAVYSEGKKAAVLSQEDISKLIESGDIRAPLKNFISV